MVQITEDYVSFETAKLLKEKGFKHWCYKCYGTAVYHKGVPISAHEEYELKDEGLEDEIEYVEGGYLYDFGCDNRKKDAKVYAAPTLQMAVKWLREVHNVFIDISSRFSKNADKDICFSYSCKKLIDTYKSSYEIGDGEWLNYEEACEAAIKYCLENLI